MKLTKSQLKQIIKEELALVLELGFGQGKPASDKWSKKQEIVLEEEDEEEKNNPWAICTAQVGREDKEKYERCVKSVKKKLNEQTGIPARLPTGDDTHARRSFNTIRNKFIKIQVQGKARQIIKFLGKGRRLSKAQASKGLKQIISHIKATTLHLVSGRQNCPGKDPHGSVYQHAYYQPSTNKMFLCNFESAWKSEMESNSTEWQNTLTHEFGHAKDTALAKVGKEFGHDPEKFKTRQSTTGLGTSGRALRQYSVSQYRLLKPFFPRLADPKTATAAYEKQISEFYGNLQELMGLVGRSKLIPEDFKIMCAQDQPYDDAAAALEKAWARKSPGIADQHKDPDRYDRQMGAFYANPVWSYLGDEGKRKACRNSKALRRAVNSLARAGQPKAAPRSMTA